MAIVTTKSKYHAALDGIGILLQGAPGILAREVKQAPIYGQRYASGDRNYTDFSFWWFWAQTDFSGGQKEDASWEDDTKFHSSEGVNVVDRVGSIILNWALTNSQSVAKNMTYNDYGDCSGGSMIVGRNNTDQKMRVTNVLDGSTAWEDTAVGASEKISCCDGLGDGTLYLGCNTVGSGASTLKTTVGGAASDVGTFTSGSGIRAIVPYSQGDGLYLFTFNAGIYFYSRAAGTFTQKTTAYPYAMAVTSTSAGNENGKGAWLIGDRVYFLVTEPNQFKTQLWAYDIGDNAYAHIYTWAGGVKITRVVERSDALYLFDIDNNTQLLGIWKYTVASGGLERIFQIGRPGDTSTLKGNVVHNATYIYFAVDDGTSDYQIWQIDNSDAIFTGITPPASYATSISMLASYGTGGLTVIKNGASGTNKFDSFSSLPNSVRLTTGYLKTSIFDGNIPAIDKLFHSVTLNFNQLTTSQSITVEYSLDGGVTFTSLGSVSNATDGGTITSKTLYFGSAIVSKTIMLKFTLTSAGGSASATLNAFSTQYVPVPDVVKSWQLNINAGSSVKRLDGGLVDKPGRELKSQLERSWITKSLVDFQDIDYAGTTINNGGTLSASATTITVLTTADFPEQGRLRCENEEMTYTGKTPTTFTGVTRGARGTTAATHADVSVINNAYRVIITDMSERVPIMLDGRNLEYNVNVAIREA